MTKFRQRWETFTDTSIFHPYDDQPGVYLQSQVSVQNGKLRFDCDQTGGWAGWFGPKNIRYGKISLGLQGFGGDNKTGMVFEGWPVSDNWSEGEACIAEANFQGSNVFAYHHKRTPNNPAENALVVDLGVTWADRHLYAWEWTPTVCRYYVDGTQKGVITNNIPQTDFRATFQSKPQPGSLPAYALVDTYQLEIDV